jgi:hypothetical protein
MYLNTFEGFELARNLLKTSPHPFYGVVRGKKSIPLSQINLPVTFGDTSNYCTETLTFEVVDFYGPYHVILWWPCYVKFITILSYTYLNLKISGPTNIITVEAKAQQVLDCEHNSIGLAAAMVTATNLKEMCLNAPPSLANPAITTMFNTFKAAEDAKAIEIDVEDLAKTI